MLLKPIIGAHTCERKHCVFGPLNGLACYEVPDFKHEIRRATYGLPVIVRLVICKAARSLSNVVNVTREHARVAFHPLDGPSETSCSSPKT